MTQQFNFVQGETFDREEGDSVEFKAITSNNPVNMIGKDAQKYVVGFINAQIEGDLYFGIDNSGIIQGVTLNRNHRDEIDQNIPNTLKHTDPPIPFHYYEVSFHNIFNSEGARIEDLYVVQIHVIKTEDKYPLYKTSGRIVYLKKGQPVWS